METYKLNDTVIAQVAKLVQVAFLTGTDIVDNLRTLELCVSEDGSLSLSPEYLENFEVNLETMMKNLEEQTNQVSITTEPSSPTFFTQE